MTKPSDHAQSADNAPTGLVLTCPDCGGEFSLRDMPDVRALLAERERAADEWWISDGDLKRGGEKVLGPFATQDLALTVRTLFEAHPSANGRTYWVCLYTPAVRQGGAS